MNIFLHIIFNCFNVNAGIKWHFTFFQLILCQDYIVQLNLLYYLFHLHICTKYYKW